MSIHEEKDWLEDLEAAYEEAEGSAPRVGDIIILPNGSGGYIIRPAVEADRGEYEAWDIRILKRAPAPAPELQAVVASSTHYLDRQVFSLDPGDGLWHANGHGWVSADYLVDPVPLVELPAREELEDTLAKVWDLSGGWPGFARLADAMLELLKGKS